MTAHPEPIHAEDQLAPGTRFGRYEITRRIGVGGMGAVYEASHVDLRNVIIR